MPKLRVHNFSISLDGYAAGPDQSVDNPLGVGGTRLHEWAFATRSGRATHGMEGGAEGVDDDFVAQGDTGIGATIMGRTCSSRSAGHGVTASGGAGGGTTRMAVDQPRSDPNHNHGSTSNESDLRCSVTIESSRPLRAILDSCLSQDRVRDRVRQGPVQPI